MQQAATNGTIARMAKHQPDKSKRPPSRENTRYVGVSLALHELLQKYADEHSTEDDRKSLTWAAKRLLRIALSAEGYGADPRKEKREE